MKELAIPVALLAASALPAHALQAQALVAHYRLDETAGASTQDASGNLQDGSLVGGVELGQPGASPATGGSARFLPTQPGQVSIVQPAALRYLRSNLSVAAWIHPSSDAGLMRIFGSETFGWSCGRSSSGLRFSVRFIQDYVVNHPVQLDRWTHVAFVFDNTFDVSFYVDGVHVGTVAGIHPATAPGPNWLIGSYDGTSQNWVGLLDDVQVYMGALTASEVAALHSMPGTTLTPTVGVPYCIGNGQYALCPCFNYGGPDAGCRNSTGKGTRLRASGSAAGAGSQLVFDADQLPPGKPALLFVGDNASAGGQGIAFLDGLRCAGGNVRRLGVRTASSTGTASWGPGLSPGGGWQGGELQRFQAWYRDPTGSPCGNGANLSHGLQIQLQP